MLIKKFLDITSITTRDLYDKAFAYLDALINEATKIGALENPEADNEYIREIGRIGIMCADYESIYMKFTHLKFKSPLVVSIEKEMEKRNLKQRQAAELLDVKESTFSQIMTGKRSVSMRMAKRLYTEFNIDPRIILEHS